MQNLSWALLLFSRLLPRHASSCRVGGTGYALFLLGGGPGPRAPQRLGLSAVSDFALHALSASHRLHKRAGDCLQDGGTVSD